MRCAWCGAEVERGAEQCAQCDVRIVWDGDTAEFLVPESWTPVFRATDPAQLPVIKSLLEANRIPFVVTDEVAQDFLNWGRVGIGYNVMIGPPKVLVPGEQAEAARELIASAGSDSPEAQVEP
jgi:hypothetical protein